jgi:zinc protease
VVVAVAGGLEAGEALAAVERAFGAWRGAGRPPAPLPAADPAARERLDRVHVPLDKEQASISVGLPGVDRQSADFTALAALNYLLGETGYAGRLGEVLVDPGIAYAVYASVLADRHAGPILITTDAARAGEALDRIINTLEAFATRGVSEAELQEAKGFLLGRLLFRFESPQAATATLAELGYFGDRAALEPFAREVLALTVDDLNAAARRFYDPARAVAVIAGR